MKAIMISDKPQWCAKMMNGEKTIEVRKNKALASAIQKLIDKYGYAVIYVYCSKDGGNLVYGTEFRGGSFIDKYEFTKGYSKQEADEIFGLLNGKVLFKFRCYKVEEIEDCVDVLSTKSLDCVELLQKSCLMYEELHAYLPSRDDDKPRGYAIHISILQIFDEPKELSEFYKVGHYEDLDKWCTDEKYINGKWCIPLTKAPQNMVYVEVE